MLIDRILYSRLATDTNITALVGERIHPTKPVLNSDIPHLVYTVSTDSTECNMDGPSAIERHTLTVDVYAKTAIEVDSILTAVKNNLHGYRGGQLLLVMLNGYTTIENDEGNQGQAQYRVIQNNEVLSRSLRWTRGSDELVRLRNLTNTTTGQLVNNATVTGTVYEQDETTVVYSFSLPYTGIPGLYQGTVPSATTSAMTNSTYRLRVVAVSASTQTFWATVQVN